MLVNFACLILLKATFQSHEKEHRAAAHYLTLQSNSGRLTYAACDKVAGTKTNFLSPCQDFVRRQPTGSSKTSKISKVVNVLNHFSIIYLGVEPDQSRLSFSISSDSTKQWVITAHILLYIYQWYPQGFPIFIVKWPLGSRNTVIVKCW